MSTNTVDRIIDQALQQSERERARIAERLISSLDQTTVFHGKMFAASCTKMPMLKIDVHPAVYFELEDSRSWYEECAKNLGNEFLCEVDRAFSAVQQAPLM
ncbi:MAG: hypothetical protein JRE61_13700 [Deltaproteobacteria bacterium]|nr:hypothetical protein [Deltaproteobacteria bacterium]